MGIWQGNINLGVPVCWMSNYHIFGMCDILLAKHLVSVIPCWSDSLSVYPFGDSFLAVHFAVLDQTGDLQISGEYIC